MHDKRPDGMCPWLLSYDALAVARPTGVYLLHFFCSGIQFYLLLSPFFALSPFDILNMF